MRKKIELEYIFSTSVKVLFPRLNTPSGLSEWFADDVYQRDGKFIFVWHDAENSATLLESKSNSHVRFQWDDGEEDEYFEFRIQTQSLTKDIALIITDFADDDDDESDIVELWDKQVDTLRRNLGA